MRQRRASRQQGLIEEHEGAMQKHVAAEARHAARPGGSEACFR